jgi:hypothetical protein
MRRPENFRLKPQNKRKRFAEAPARYDVEMT